MSYAPRWEQQEKRDRACERLQNTFSSTLCILFMLTIKQYAALNFHVCSGEPNEFRLQKLKAYIICQWSTETFLCYVRVAILITRHQHNGDN
jgi:hypothetical protein